MGGWISEGRKGEVSPPPQTPYLCVDLGAHAVLLVFFLVRHLGQLGGGATDLDEQVHHLVPARVGSHARGHAVRLPHVFFAHDRHSFKAGQGSLRGAHGGLVPVLHLLHVRQDGLQGLQKGVDVQAVKPHPFLGVRRLLHVVLAHPPGQGRDFPVVCGCRTR